MHKRAAPTPAASPATHDDGHAALRQAQAMTLMLQSYLASDHAQDYPIAESLVNDYCLCLSDRIAVGMAALQATRRGAHG
jgi:hypothetical protein